MKGRFCPKHVRWVGKHAVPLTGFLVATKGIRALSYRSQAISLTKTLIRRKLKQQLYPSETELAFLLGSFRFRALVKCGVWGSSTVLRGPVLVILGFSGFSSLRAALHHQGYRTWWTGTVVAHPFSTVISTDCALLIRNFSPFIKLRC